MHHHLDSLAYHNRLRYLPSLEKLGFATTLLILSYLFPIPGQIFIALWLGVWIVIYARIPWLTYLQLQSIPLSFWLLSLPALVVGVGPDFPLGSWYFYLIPQGISLALEVLCRAIAVSSCLYFLLLTTPFLEILRALQRLGCPSLLLELLALMYRFIFLLTETVEELLIAQKSRHGYRTWQTTRKSLALVISQLLWRTLENYRQISLGLTSRGFQGQLKVWHSSARYSRSFRYTLEAVLGCFFLLLSWGCYSLC